MTDWTISHQVTLIACGMFLWDYSTTLWFELKFLRGKLRLRWALIPYFLTRYITLGFVIGCLIFHTSRGPVNCDAIYVGGNLLGKAAIASASVNLAVRTAIIWSYRWYVVISLATLVIVEVILTGVGLLARGFFATWSYEHEQCIGYSGSQKHDLGIFALYALCVDCTIVILTIVGLRKFDSKSCLASALIRQGLTFFFLVLLFQTFVTAAVFAKDADVLVYLTSVLCAVIVPMVSCHMVRSILSGSSSPSEQCAPSHGSSTAAGGYSQERVQFTTYVETGSRPVC